MKKSLKHLPPRKRWEIEELAKLILANGRSVEMIILYGSYARGEWVEDLQKVDGHWEEYKSDYDILVVTESRKAAEHEGAWHSLELQWGGGFKQTRTHTSIIAHDIRFLNKNLEEGQYFFSDIKKEGILLYDSGKFKLARRRKLKMDEIKKIARRNFKTWFDNAESFLDSYEDKLGKKDYKIAAFMLHQATEHAYHAALLVFTGYKPRYHNLEKLGQDAAPHSVEFKLIFPRGTEKGERLFDLLKRAYVDARYSVSYEIKKSELEYLAGRVKELHELVKRLCAEKIASFLDQ